MAGGGSEEREGENDHHHEDTNEHDEKLSRQVSEASFCGTEAEDDEGEEGKEGHPLNLGPLCTIKEQLEKDKDDESLRRWKEQLLGRVDLNSVGECSCRYDFTQPDLNWVGTGLQPGGLDY